MASNSGFDLIQHGGWRAGLNNLLRAELGRWWRMSTWWTQSLIWIVVIDLLLMTVILGQRSEGSEALAEEVLTLYGVFGGLFVMIGGIVLMQGALVGEKAAGTAAWVEPVQEWARHPNAVSEFASRNQDGEASVTTTSICRVLTNARPRWRLEQKGQGVHSRGKTP